MGSPIRIDSMPVYNQNATDILRDLELLRARTQKTAATLHKMDNAQEAFNLSYHDFTNITTHIEYLKTAEASPKNLELKRQFEHQKLMMDQLLNTKIKALGQDRCQLADNLKETCFLIENTQGKILNVELLKWKREQQLQGNGARYNCTLDMIQGYCESLAEIIWMTRQQIKEAERLKNLISKYVDPPNMVDVLPNLNAQITQCLSHLVTSTFIIEKQPPQVMKTNTRFSATVRLLTGSKLNVYMTPPQVKAQIICESQANALLKNEKIGKSDASGEILNNMGVMEYNTHSKVLSISLRNMQLKKIKRRPEKRGTESVMDEKFSLYFSSTFSIGGGELVFQVWTLSLPVVVIVHGNQEPNAHATITWDNAFAEPGRSPFVVPDKRPWKMIADVLMMKFESATGRTLDAENLNFLAEKAFRAECADYSNMLLNWSQFCKEPLPDRSFTFWDWFYAVMKLTREHLKNVWTDGHIMGFVRKRKAEEMLASQVKGTFLLRFSDSELGGITIAWKGGE
ncbi:signal transducer and activator of transcription 5B isoform X2 [Diaphorina citri]|uniref:Signal transducer and transcription activator n=1 Tax=Diaphorina citri TaxID=121845 RepID=A0A3Q0IXU7_DIACI|nr:signal transducer and activator of transcription 5B isoform X2 [Diaphorina citri]